LSQNSFEDYYERLQLSPNSDAETIERVYRLLAKRYHPDNRETGCVEKFGLINRAYTVLSDPDKRAAYDIKYDENRSLTWQIFDQSSASDSFEEDKRIFQGVLSLLYISRRQDANNAGMGIIELERLLGCPHEHLEFHIWYLKEKGWVERLENGRLAISSDGIDKVVAGDLMLRKDRMLADGGQDEPEEQDAREVTVPRASLESNLESNVFPDY
jgi:curved DNA-binding protein CbpA